MDKTKRLKMSVAFVTGILLIILYCFIFSFSEQDGETSAGLSYRFTLLCTEIVNHLSGNNMDMPRMEAIALYFSHPMRKVAHFCEYMVMGILVSNILFQFKYGKKPQVFICLIWVFLSASFDEIHQLFIPDRYGNFADVCLDSSGGMFGFLLLYLLYKFLVKKSERIRTCYQNKADL